MQLSNETLAILKNFASINQGIEFKAGNVLRTVSTGKTILAQAELVDSFPEEFCVYDLNQFLSVHGLFKDSPVLDYDESNVIFKVGTRKVKYRKTAKGMVVTPPEKNLMAASVDFGFTLDAADYDWIMKSANVLSSPNVALVSDGEEVLLVAMDVTDDSAHTNSIRVADGDGRKFKIVYKTENIKMIPGSYVAEVTFGKFTHFKNTQHKLEYWIALEKESEF